MTKCDTGAGLTIFDFFTNMPFEWPLMVYLSMRGGWRSGSCTAAFV